VCAKIGVRQAEPQNDLAVEGGGGNAGILQVTENTGRAVAGADGIDQYPHRDTAPVRGDQAIGNPEPSCVAVENVGFDHDRAPGPLDRSGHGIIGLVAGGKDRKAVAGRQRVSGDAVAENLQCGHWPAELSLYLVGRQLELRQNAPDRLVTMRPPLQDGLATNPVDADDRIDQRTDDRGQDDDADPADRRSHLALGHRRMNGRDRAHPD